MRVNEETTILIVEDSVTCALAEALRLRGFGYKVIIAHSGEEAVELATKDETINLILMDIELEAGLDGTEAAKRILAARHLPVIFLTAHTEKEYIDRLKAITRYGVVAKNSGEFILQSSIEMALELFEAHRNNEKNMKMLQDSEEKYRTALEHSNDMIWMLDREGKFTFINNHAQEKSGYLPSDLLGMNFSPLLSGEDLPRVWNIFQSALEGAAQNFEVEYLKKDASKATLSVNIAPVFTNGKISGTVSFGRDITESKLAEEALAESESRFREIFNAVNDAIFIHDAKNGRIVDVNRRMCEMYGFTREEALLCGPGDLSANTPPYSSAEAIEKIHLASTEGPQTFDWLARARDGHLFWVEVSLSFALIGSQQRILAVVRDISERKHAEEQIYNLAFYDALTQLPNRRLLNDRIKQAMAASKRSGLYCALLFMDLDNFKSLNDTQGHVAGDILLKDAASRILNCVREADTVARFGGDEFVVMLGELDTDKAESIKQTSIVAEKIRNVLAKPYVLTLQQESKAAMITVEHHCTASIGVVMFQSHENSVEDIIKWADIAMYKAKEGGGNSIHFYE